MFVYRREVFSVTGLDFMYITLCTDNAASPGKLLPKCISVQGKFGN